MAILENVQVPASAQTIAAAGNRQPFGVVVNRPRAKVWANIEIETSFGPVQLPLGIPVDTMEPASVTGTNLEIVKRNKARNELLAAIQKLGAGMAPGSDCVLSHAQVRIRRVSEDLEVSRDETLGVDGFLELLMPKA
jgi:hypothetical protein